MSSGPGKIKCSNEFPQQTVCEVGCLVYLKEIPHRLSYHDPCTHVIMMQLRDGKCFPFTQTALHVARARGGNRGRISVDEACQENEAVDCCAGPLRHLSNVARHALFPLLSMPQNRKGLTNAAVADFSYATEEFVCGVDIMCGKMQGHVVLPLPTRYDAGVFSAPTANGSCLFTFA